MSLAPSLLDVIQSHDLLGRKNTQEKSDHE